MGKKAFCAGHSCISNTQALACKAHFTKHGKGEKRIPNPDTCRAAGFQCDREYCNAYSDLKKAFCSGSTCTTDAQATACHNHWVKHGKGEHRSPDPEACRLPKEFGNVPAPSPAQKQEQMKKIQKEEAPVPEKQPE